MSEKSQKKDWDKNTFDNALGHKAQVERWTADGSHSANANLELQRIGHQIREANESLRSADYMGSLAVHYYLTPELGHPYFVCQPGAISKTPEALIQHGITDLRNEIIQLFGHKPQRKRSGF